MFSCIVYRNPIFTIYIYIYENKIKYTNTYTIFENAEFTLGNSQLYCAMSS